MKRGLWAFGGGVVVSLVTAIVLPNDRVRYGVLTLIGSCILIWILLDKVLKKIPAGVGLSVLCYSSFSEVGRSKTLSNYLIIC